MTDQTKYKHIKVSTDDDVVIKVGAKAEALEDDDSEGRIQSNSDHGNSPVENSKPEHQNDGYKPTTLEDIQSSKMPKIQVAIICIAIVAIIAFVIWYATSA